MTAHEDLRDALVALLRDGDRPPCCWPDVGPWWTADDHETRARAAEHCHGCAILTPCHAAAESTRERFGGVGRTRPRARRPPDDEEGPAVTDDTRPQLDHAPACQRRGVPLLCLSWPAAPSLVCPECGRTAPADDTRPTDPNPERTTP